jgi:hypothetical protein
MPITYEKIATTTLGSTSSTVTFSSIPSTYTDLVLILDTLSANSGDDARLQFNGDTGTTYSSTQLFANGPTPTSNRNTSQTSMRLFNDLYSTTRSVGIANIMNYGNSTRFKTALSRFGTGSISVGTFVGLWRNTSAITSLTVVHTGSGFASGSTFTIYGIKAA